MPFRFFIVAALAAVSGIAVALPAAGAQLLGPAAPAPAKVRVVECERGASAEQRQAVFRGAMRTIEGSERMGMRFTLLERIGGRRFDAVAAPGLEVWRKSRPGVRRFVHRQRVVALAAGARYRMVVDFRWYGSDGEVVRRARRRSSTCRQPGRLPNLRVVRIAGRPADGARGTERYSIRVVNSGRAAADAVDVSLSVDGAEIDTAQVGRLAPGEASRAFVNGPSCNRSLEARVDPDDIVAESSERDNVLRRRC